MKYDYLIVGAGLFGATFAYEAAQKGKKCLVIEKRNHIAGNIYTENLEGINIHKYGPHIFHTKHKEIWDYVNRFAEFNNFVCQPIARIGKESYNLPFNMNTFSKMWPWVFTPAEAEKELAKQRVALERPPANLEEQALALVGRDIYEKLIKGYTEKQWGRKCTELPAFIIKRLPCRLTYDNNYFDDPYQGVPIGGYTQIISKMLESADVELNCDFYEKYRDFRTAANKLIFTGMIDEYFDYCYGPLEYRSLRFETELLDTENYQGAAVVNYTGGKDEAQYTRVIEHKHFEFGKQKKTVVTREYPMPWEKGAEAFYPINDDRNNEIYVKYAQLAREERDVIFCGRLGAYKYFNMDEVIQEARKCAERELEGDIAQENF